MYSSRAPGPWSTGLCDCFSDCKSCCLTYWCPCVTFGRIAEIVDEGATSCVASGALYLLLVWVGVVCCYSCTYRSKIRRRYALEESPCGDCLVHCFCGLCALCQEYRELQNKGFNMGIGYLFYNIHSSSTSLAKSLFYSWSKFVSR
ncbi:hypothetical protein L484_027249 [Morus notabilis]|uniref:Protein PLANT CADMIUM RESISTANCE 2 n=1 Tax=Morus notabilis TaxID=981085 RepID=W9QJV2_9ROSA|nr:hypothetical protein L484_027249 [Morus notabilis]